MLEALSAAEECGLSVILENGKLMMRAKERPPQRVIDEVRRYKAEIIALRRAEAQTDVISMCRSTTEIGVQQIGKAALVGVPKNVPDAWARGVADLLVMNTVGDWPPRYWRQLQDDCISFLRGHAAAAHRLGWDEIALFGVHPVKPWRRLDCVGLVPLLAGSVVLDLTRREAELRKPSGAVLRFRRPTETNTIAMPVWEFGKRAPCSET